MVSRVRDHHQQRRRRHARDPVAGLVHACCARRAHRHVVFPGAGRHAAADRNRWRPSRGRRPGSLGSALTIAWRRGGSPRNCARSSSANISSIAATFSGGMRRRPCSKPLMVGTWATTQLQAALGRAQHDRVAAGIARAPEADALGVDDVEAFEVADGAPPIGDLTPRIDVLARQALAGAEAAVVVQQHDEARLGKRLRKRLDARAPSRRHSRAPW